MQHTLVTAPPRSLTQRVRHDLAALGVLLVGYSMTAYVAVPAWWQHQTRTMSVPAPAVVTHTRSGIAGDPINVALIGSEKEVIDAMLKAGWNRVDRTTVRSSAKIVESVVAGRPYPTAPVSNLYLFGRKQDLAFERLVGHSARQRHHVRFWRSDQTVDDRAIWLGAATFDRSVGFSHRTGQITHHIAADVDAERNQLVAGLKHAGVSADQYTVPGIGPTQNGKNGGGDRYFTDGKIDVAVLTAGVKPAGH